MIKVYMDLKFIMKDLIRTFCKISNILIIHVFELCQSPIKRNWDIFGFLRRPAFYLGMSFCYFMGMVSLVVTIAIFIDSSDKNPLMSIFGMVYFIWLMLVCIATGDKIYCRSRII